MIHLVIEHLRTRLPDAQWLFLLTAYELNRRDWQERRDILDRLSINKKASTIVPLTEGLTKLGLIETKKTRSGPNITSCQIRLTPHGRAEIQAAIKLATLAGKPTPVPA
jgi:DNA-binding MarR family transcriptional regulator